MSFYYEIALLGKDLNPLSYESKEALSPGQVVIVSLKNQGQHKGIVLSEVKKPSFKTKDIISSLNEALSPMQLELARFISHYYVSSLGIVLKLFSPLPAADALSLELKAQQRQLQDIFIKEMLSSLPKLSSLQQEALDFAQLNKASLLFADTGAGKTEIYIHLIAKALEQGGQALLLMPEIALGPGMQKRMKKYFKKGFALWHSKVSASSKARILKALANGDLQIIIGARSALFLPFTRLSLIVVDEEHDSSYKSNQAPRINARDLAVFAANKLGVRALLGSATPSAQSFLRLPHFRIEGSFYKGHRDFYWDEDFKELLSPKLLAALKDCISRGKQAILFLPVRANFRHLICADCERAVLCPFCAQSLSIHFKSKRMKCHYCLFSCAIPKECPSCQNPHFLVKKPGTAELCRELKRALPDEEILRLDSDTLSSGSRLEKILDDFSNRKASILVGTQMVAKGHDYHNVALVAILGLDAHLSYPEYKAKEDTLALAMQVAGRTGRAASGLVFMQTKQRGFFEAYIKNYQALLEDELPLREGLWPPYTRLLRLIITSKNNNKAANICTKVVSGLEAAQNGSFMILGFGPCDLPMIAGLYRYSILLSSLDFRVLIKIAQSVSSIKEVDIDMDPLDFS